MTCVGADAFLTQTAGIDCPVRMLSERMPSAGFQRLTMGQSKSAAGVKNASAPTALKSSTKYVSLILDPVIQGRVRELIRERDALRVQLSLSEAEKKAMEVAIKKVPQCHETLAEPRGRPLKNVSAWKLKPADVEALKKAISPDFMDRQGWRPGPRGEVLNSQGVTLYEPEYRQAIKKVLASKKEPG